MQDEKQVRDDTQAQQEPVTQAENPLAQELEAEQRKAEEYLDLLKRVQADFINYRHRVNQELEATSIAGQMTTIQQLLPVLDDLGRALTSAPSELCTHPWVQGIQLVTRRLIATLEQFGVRQVGKVGERFDPRWHEAVSTETRSDLPEGTISQVARPGFVLGEKVIRPAQVVVTASTSPQETFPDGLSSHT